MSVWPYFKMWRLALTLCVCGGLVSGAIKYHRAYSARMSNFTCGEPLYDFGTVGFSEAAKLNHEFTVTNQSSHPVIIVKKLLSCGCTNAELTSEHVGPGGSIKLAVQTHWSDRQGRQSASVTLITDRQDILVLGVSGNIVAPFKVWPSSLDFGRVPAGQCGGENIYDHNKFRLEGPARGVRSNLFPVSFGPANQRR